MNETISEIKQNILHVKQYCIRHDKGCSDCVCALVFDILNNMVFNGLITEDTRICIQDRLMQVDIFECISITNRSYKIKNAKHQHLFDDILTVLKKEL